MLQNNYFSNNADIVQHFDKLIEWKDLVFCAEQDFRDHSHYKETDDALFAHAPKDTEEALEMYQACLEGVGDIAGHVVSARAAEMDRQGLSLKDGKVIFPQAMIECFEKFKQAGLQAYALKRIHGGLNLPFIVQGMILEVLARADCSFALLVGTLNLGATIEVCADEKTAHEWVTSIASAETWAAMALTEPNYGSDLSNVRTKAVKDEKGLWRITGTKRFITQGCGFADKPAAILTLARTGTPESGARGLSFFIVKSTDVEVAGIEKKLGIHASPTCEIVYDNAPAILMGEEGRGLTKHAMGMMNEARLGIAAQALGIAQAAMAEADKYASEREQFGVLIRNIPAVAKILKRIRREVAAMRCLLYEASVAVDLYAWSKHASEKAGKPITEMPKGTEAKKWQKLGEFPDPCGKVL